MVLSKKEILKALAKWNQAWDDHDLDEVMALFHPQIVFENWTGGKAEGIEALRKAWEPWFKNHGGFHFIGEDTFVDEAVQKVLYEWTVDWQSSEKGYQGKRERRRGLDVMHFQDGKIIRKSTYCKTVLEINGKRIKLAAE